MAHGLLDPAPEVYAGLKEILAGFPASAVITENINLGALPLAIEHPPGERPALITLGVIPPSFTSADAPPFGPGLLPLAGERGRARDQAVREQMAVIFDPVHAYFVKVFGAMGLPVRDSVFDTLAKVPDHYLQLTIPSFEYPRGDAPASFRCVGPVLPEPAGNVEPPGWWADLDGGRPVVAVTQGTLENRDFSALIAPTLRALADLDVTVVAATGTEDGPDRLRAELGEVPANARLAGFVPFDRLLPLTDVLVTNGGYGGAHIALSHGVPMVVAGEAQDKPEVAARVEWSGTGVNLRTDRPSEDAVRAAVRDILGGGGFRDRARALRAEMREYDALGAIAALVG
ncbi:glycosyltransferase [Streptomyces liangshanensis]|uniref:glycosyltransferase n=1 Tax=Streptomyces liangshanensis TaxID=2717324 RepID=UPI0036DF0C0E